MSKPNFLQFMQEKDQLDEAFNSAPYELTMGKKNAGDVFFTFIDEDEKEYRIQFYTPQGLGKNVRQVFIGQKRGSVYPDAIARFKNPMRVIASMIEATKQFLATPLGKTIDGYAVNFSKKALERGMTLIPKIIRQSGLKQKLNVMDLTYAPVPDRGYVWLVRKGKDPAQVFDGPKMQGITWDDPDKVGDVPVQDNTPDVGASSSVDDSNGWKLTSNGDQPMLIWVGKERGRVNTANIAPHYNEPGVYVGAYMNEKSVRGQSADFIARQLKLPQVPISILNDFTTASTKFWKGSQQKSAPADSNTTIGARGVGTGSGSSEIEINRDWYNSSDTGLVLKSGRDPIRGNYVRLMSGSREVAAFYGYDFDKYPDGTEVSWNMKRGFTNQDLVGASMTKQKKGMYDQYTFKKGAQLILVVDVDTSNNTNTLSSNDLKIPRNAEVFGETGSGFSVRWAVNFPETGKYAGTSMITNVTYYHDKGKVAFTPIVSQKGRTLNNPKTYELPLNKDLVQSVIDEISSKMEYLSRNLQQLKSQTYNPNQVFLNDITITDKGEVIWNDYNLSDGKVTQIMLSMISAENKRLEKVTNNPDITLPKKQAEVVEFINRMIDIDLGPYLREPKKRDVVLFDSSELSINQLNNIERLGRETGKWSLQPNGGMGHALFLNVW